MDERELPENIHRIIDMVSAIVRRIQHKRLDKSAGECLYMSSEEGVVR